MERKLREKLPGGVFRDVSATRSRTMGAIRSKHTKSTERRLRMALIRAGIKGWTLHAANMPGKPDFYFLAERVAIFVDGCFWHGCPRCGHVPKTNTEFWEAKIHRNRQRDRMNKRLLKRLGIRSIRFWEHSLKSSSDVDKVIRRIQRYTITLPNSAMAVSTQP